MADNKYIKLAAAKSWKKLAKLATSKDSDTVIAVAEACGTGRAEEPYNILVDLLSSKDDKVKLAAIRGLGTLRYDLSSQATRLHWLAERLPEGSDELQAAISDALADIRGAK
jgi:HEAT repeat protein